MKLDDELKQISMLRSMEAALSWDQETYMPAAAVAQRAKQLAYLTGKAHEFSTSPRFGQLLDGAANEGFSEADVRELRFHYERATKLPQELVERDSETSSLAKAAWAEARVKDDFSLFAPHLEKLLVLAREKADLWGYDDEPYDALLAGYERAATTKEVATLFGSIEKDLAMVAAAAVENTRTVPAGLLRGPAPVATQQTLNREVAESLGFDFSSGRIDTTTHPFCTTLGPDDVRLTTRYDENDFMSSLFGVMHEVGHGLYEQGLPSAKHHLPSGQAISLGIHESQSRLWENHVGRSRVFWEKWLPRAQELFPHLQKLSLDEVLAAVNRASYSFLRVEADEATYDLHILLRFQLERRLLRGELSVAEVPAAWNDAFSKLFGMTPPTDREGCLQDIHWSMGGLGYFPTYTLGNLNAAQLFETALTDEKVATAFSQGDFIPLLDWMRENIHAHGSTFHPQELMQKVTGSVSSPKAHLQHLRTRFLT